MRNLITFLFFKENHLSNLPVENLNVLESWARQTSGEIFALMRNHGLRAGSQRAESLEASCLSDVANEQARRPELRVMGGNPHRLQCHTAADT